MPRVTIPYMYTEDKTIHRPSYSIFLTCFPLLTDLFFFFYNRKAKNLLNRICEEGKIPESLVRDTSFNKHDMLLFSQSITVTTTRKTFSWVFIPVNKICLFLLVVGVVLWLVLDVAASCCSRWTSHRNYDSSQ